RGRTVASWIVPRVPLVALGLPSMFACSPVADPILGAAASIGLQGGAAGSGGGLPSSDAAAEGSGGGLIDAAREISVGEYCGDGIRNGDGEYCDDGRNPTQGFGC